MGSKSWRTSKQKLSARHGSTYLNSSTQEAEADESLANQLYRVRLYLKKKRRGGHQILSSTTQLFKLAFNHFYLSNKAAFLKGREKKKRI